MVVGKSRGAGGAAALPLEQRAFKDDAGAPAWLHPAVLPAARVTFQPTGLWALCLLSRKASCVFTQRRFFQDRLSKRTVYTANKPWQFQRRPVLTDAPVSIDIHRATLTPTQGALRVPLQPWAREEASAGPFSVQT